MRRFLTKVAVCVAGLGLAGPAAADDDDKDYFKSARKRQREYEKRYREDQKRYEERYREQQKRSEERYRESWKRQEEYSGETRKRYEEQSRGYGQWSQPGFEGYSNSYGPAPAPAYPPAYGQAGYGYPGSEYPHGPGHALPSYGPTVGGTYGVTGSVTVWPGGVYGFTGRVHLVPRPVRVYPPGW